MGHDGAGESILGVGINIHLHHSVVERLAEFLNGRARATVENEIHLGFRAVFVRHGLLTLAKDRRLEFHRTRLVGPVDVAEGSGEEETTNRLQRLIHFHHVLRSRVKFLDRQAGRVVPVFFTANAACLNFEDDAELGAFLKQVLGGFQVFLQFHNGTIKHVGLEKRALSCGDALAGGLKERLQEAVDLGRVAVVGVESDEDVVFLRKEVAGLGQDDGSKHSIFHSRAGGELTTTSGNLDDPVGFRFGKGFESAVDRR